MPSRYSSRSCLHPWLSHGTSWYRTCFCAYIFGRWLKSQESGRWDWLAKVVSMGWWMLWRWECSYTGPGNLGRVSGKVSGNGSCGNESMSSPRAETLVISGEEIRMYKSWAGLGCSFFLAECLLFVSTSEYHFMKACGVCQAEDVNSFVSSNVCHVRYVLHPQKRCPVDHLSYNCVEHLLWLNPGNLDKEWWQQTYWKGLVPVPVPQAWEADVRSNHNIGWWCYHSPDQ